MEALRETHSTIIYIRLVDMDTMSTYCCLVSCIQQAITLIQSGREDIESPASDRSSSTQVRLRSESIECGMDTGNGRCRCEWNYPI